MTGWRRDKEYERWLDCKDAEEAENGQVPESVSPVERRAQRIGEVSRQQQEDGDQEDMEEQDGLEFGW